jgi:hypothetical protein
MRSSPYPTFNEPRLRDYNIKLGPLNGRLFGSLQTEFNDNINLAENGAESDVFFFPNFGVGFQWPISERNILEFAVGMGYRAYINHPNLNSISITPDSRLAYQMRIAKVNILLRDNFQLQVDPLSRPDLSGAPGALLNYRRFNNDIGVQAEWPARRNLTLVSSYDYILDRSLNNDFTALDREDHNFAAGAFTKLGAAWNVGIVGSMTFTEYARRIQNDGTSYSIGPQVSWKLTRFLTLDANVAYTHSEFDQTGTIIDTSGFDGVSFGLAVRHNINSRMSESLRAARTLSPGFGSNFNDLTVLQYGLSWRLNSFIGLNTTLSYEHLASSGSAGETADRYLWYLGSNWSIARRWTIGLGYSFAWKDSNQALRDYRQDRVTLDLTHDF